MYSFWIRHFIRFVARCSSQVLCQVFALTFFLFLKDLTFTNCSSTVDSFFKPATSSFGLLLFSFLNFFKDAIHAALTYATFWLIAKKNTILCLKMRGGSKLLHSTVCSACVQIQRNDTTLGLKGTAVKTSFFEINGWEHLGHFHLLAIAMQL